ncbi:hypothetical protein BH23PLA1_BH23PLA1_08220 [soil metagenome]
MPEASYLHIRTRELRATRVLALTGPSLRIGRGAQCELRLADPALAEVHCLLRRRGESWYVQPVGPPGQITMDGRAVEHQRPLPMGVVLRVGEHWLTLRPTGAEPTEEPGPEVLASEVVGDWTEEPTLARVADADQSARSPEQVQQSPAPAVADKEPRQEHLARWETRLQQRERWLEERQSEKLWEARWRAAGQTLRSQATTRTQTTVLPSPTPSPSPSFRPARTTQVEAKAEPIASPAKTPRAGRGVAPSRFVPFVVGREAKSPISRVDTPATAPTQGSTEPQEPMALVAEPPTRTRRTAAPRPTRPVLEPAPMVSRPEPKPEPEPIAAERIGPTVPPRNDHRALRVPPVAEARPAPPVPDPVAEESEAPLPQPTADPEPPMVEAKIEVGAEAVVNTSPCSLLTSEPALGQGTTEPAEALAADEPSEALREESARRSPRQRTDRAEPLSARRLRRPRRKLGVARIGEERNPAQPQLITSLLVEEPHVEPTTLSPAPPLLAGSPSIGLEDLVTLLSGGTLGSLLEDQAPLSSAEAERVEVVPVMSEPEPVPVPDPVPMSAEASSVVEAPEVEAPEVDEPVGGNDREAFWPSAQSILAGRGPRIEPASPARPNLRRARANGPQPTVGAEPEHWKIPRPRWLAVPALLLASGLGFETVSMSWIWALEQRLAGQVADRLLGSSGAVSIDTSDLLEREQALAEPSWWNSKGEHLYLRAASLSLGANASSVDPTVQNRLDSLLLAARQTAPGHPGLRLALARQGEGGFGSAPELGPSLGLSRDVLSMAWTGRQLLRAGKMESAREVYRSALDLAAMADPDRLLPPRYQSDPLVRRYALPHEDLLGRVIREMADHPDWRFEDWSETLPSFAVAPLAAGRVLRERGSADADRALELAARRAEEPAPAGCDPAIHLASGAEALALTGRWQEARSQYQAALDLVPEVREEDRQKAETVRDQLRRCWALNLADLNARLGDTEGQRQALRAAMVSDPTDEITQQAIRAQLGAGLNLIGQVDTGLGRDRDR